MTPNISRGTVITSLIFKFIERIAVKGLGLIISIILARLLAPEAFGQVAIITVFINLSQMIIQSGLTTALVQNKDVQEDDYSTVFYVNLLTAIFLVLVIFLCAPFIAQYYEEEMLIWPLRVHALSLIFGAFNSVQMSRMQREMRFKPMMICSLISTIMSGILGVYLAYKGADIWALIIYYFSHVVFTSIAMFVIDRWLPKMVFSFTRARILFDYGWKMLVSGMLCSLYADIRSLIIGKVYTTEDLGYYNRGQQFPNILSSTLDSSIQAVMFPAISASQESKERMRMLLKKSTTTCALFVFPAMVGLAMISESFVSVLLTDKWLPCVVYMQLICLAEASIPFSSSNLTAIKSSGRSDMYMRLEIIRRIVMLSILLVSVFAFHSVVAIAVGYILSCWIDVLIIIQAEKKILGYGVRDQFKDVWKIAVSTVLMGGLVYIIGAINKAKLWAMLIQIPVAIISYSFFCYVLKEESFMYMLKMGKGLLKNHSRS